MSNLPAEALAVVTGIFPEKSPGRGDIHEASLLPGKWRAMVLEFFHKKSVRYKLVRAPFSQKKMVDKLAVGIDPQDIIKNFVDADLVTAYLTIINNAREYVRSKWPSFVIQNFAGPQRVEPGRLFVDHATAIYSVLNDPTNLVNEMMSGTLMDAQVKAVKTIYPSLFQMLTMIIEERRHLELTKSLTWTVPWQKERVLRILYQMPVSTDIADAPKPSPKMGMVPDRIKMDLGDQSTRIQRIAAK